MRNGPAVGELSMFAATTPSSSPVVIRHNQSAQSADSPE
jgi:hypothetical protein